MNSDFLSEPRDLISTRIYVPYCSDASFCSENFEELEQFVHAQSRMVSIYKVDVPKDLSMTRLFEIRDLVKAAPPNIHKRIIIGWGEVAFHALILSLIVSIDEVFAFNPDPMQTNMSSAMELGKVVRSEVLDTCSRYVIGTFENSASEGLLPKLSNWTSCVKAPPGFSATLGNENFEGILYQICTGKEITLPRRFVKITSASNS